MSDATTGTPRNTSARATRLACWAALAVAGILALALASRSGRHADVSRALGWSMLAAAGVSLLLGRIGRQVVAVLGAALAVGTVFVVARGEGHWALWIAGVLGLAGALGQLVLAPRWPAPGRRYDRAAATGRPRDDVDVWKAFDAGMDPTSDEFGDSLQARETSPVVTRTRGAADSGPDQEDR